MTLYPIHSMGIRAWCSDVIIDPEDMETVYFLSVCGYQVTVKGIVANLLENCGVRIDVDGEEHHLARSDMAYKIEMKKLPSGLVHAVMMPKLALPKNDEEKQNRFFVITNEHKEILALFFKHLDEKTEIPLHPSWTAWLWKTFQKQDGWLVPLHTVAGNFKGYLFNYYTSRLHDLIAEAIRRKVPDIVRCMTWKGEKTNGGNHRA